MLLSVPRGRKKAIEPDYRGKPAEAAPAPSVEPSSIVSRGLDDAEQKPRLSIPLLPDGSVDFETLRGSSKEKLKAVLNHPATRAGLGITDSAFTARQAGAVYAILGQIERTAARWYYPPEIADCFLFSAEETALLAQPTADVLNKRATDWMRQNADLVQLAMLLSLVHYRKFEQASAMAKATAERDADGEPAKPNGQAGPEAVEDYRAGSGLTP